MASIASTVPPLPGDRDDDGRRRLEPLGFRSCVELLTGGRLGRVIYTSGAMPAAQPISYGIVDDEIVFTVDCGSALDRAVTGAVVAFEVDDIDLDTRGGWSVLAVGQAHHVIDPQRLADLDGRVPPSPWNGPVTSTIAIPIAQVTGRRLADRYPPA